MNANKTEKTFNGAVAGASICITVITLITITDKRDIMIVDEILSFANIMFLITIFFSFFNFKKRYIKLVMTYILLVAFCLLFVSSVFLIFQY